MSQNLELEIDSEQWKFLSSKIEEKREAMTEANADYIFIETEKLFLNLKCQLNQSNEESINQICLDTVFQVPKLLSSCFNKDFDLLVDCQEKNYENIFKKYLQAAEMCLKILLICLDSQQNSNTSKSIIQVSLTALQQTYNHCKDSETYYGKFFDDFTNLLGSLYNQMEKVQNAVLKWLEELIHSNSYQENDFDDIALISNKVSLLWEIVTTLDRMTAVVIWKIFLKLISKYKNKLQRNFMVDNSVSALIFDIKNIVECCYVKIELKEQLDESEIKMCIFELSSLKKMIDLFKEDLKETTLIQMKELFLLLYNLLIQCHSVTDIQEKDLNVIKILIKASKPIILAVCFNPFIDIISPHCIKDLPENLLIPLIVLKLTAINFIKLNSSSFQHLLQSGNILTDFFSALTKNKICDDFQLVSLKIPGSLFKDTDENQSEILTLYDHSYKTMIDCCKLITYSSDKSHLLEKTWLNMYVLSSDVVSLFISDVWIYYLRCSTIAHIFESCEMLSDVIISGDGTNVKIKNLLIRMLKFLPAEQKIKLFENRKQLLQIFGNHKLMCRFGLSNAAIPLPLQHVFNENINSILSSSSNSHSNNFEKVVQRVVSFLDLCCICVDKFSPSDMLKLMEFFINLNESCVYDIQNAIIIFLKTLNGKTLSNNEKQVDALTSSIAILLSKLMNSTNYIIGLEAFNLYFSLARSTPHSIMIKKTVMRCPSLVPRIKSFAEQVPVSGFLKEEQRRIYFQNQLVKPLHFNKCIENSQLDETQALLCSIFM